MTYKCGECGQELPSPDTRHTYEDCMKYELAGATALLVKYKAWDLAKQVMTFIQEHITEEAKK